MESLRMMLGGRFETAESLSLLVVRVSFSDLDFETGSEHDEQHDSLYFANELRHLGEYFSGASMGRFALDWEIAPGIVELSRPQRYYGADGLWMERMVELLMETVEATDPIIDYSRFEAFAVIHAGAGQETDVELNSPEQLNSGFIDPYEMEEALSDTLGTPGVPTNDTLPVGDTIYVDNLMVLPEKSSQDGRIFGSLGIYAFELGLRLGMVPLFDPTPPEYADSQGIGTFGLMGWGLYNAEGFVPAFPCAFNRYLMGWVEPVDIETGRDVRIRDINTAVEGDTSLVRIPINASEYFLVANRVHDTNFNYRFDFGDVDRDGRPENEDTLLGAEFDFFLTADTVRSWLEEDSQSHADIRHYFTGSGLMVWHVDEGVITRALESGFFPNGDRDLKGVDLEEADGVQDLDRPGGSYSFGDYYDTFRRDNNDRFGVKTVPSSSDNSGIATGIEIFDISDAGPVMSFSMSFSSLLESERTSLDGDAGGISPLPVDLDGLPGEELFIAADTGLIYIIYNAGGEDWTESKDTFAVVRETIWTGPPVFTDLDGDGSKEVFITSQDCQLYAFRDDGSQYALDGDESPGSLPLRGDIVSVPMAVEADGDEPCEILVLSSDGDSTYANIVGFAYGGDPFWVVVEKVELQLSSGILLSNPARGRVTDQAGGEMDGFFFCTAGSAGEPALHYVPLMIPGISGGTVPVDAVTPFTETLSRRCGARGILTPAAGDIDGDGSDEMAVAAGGTGLLYFDPRSGVRSYTIPGDCPSSPVLADIDGDGIMETALRDNDRLYLFSGYGVAITGWPVRLPQDVVDLESACPPSAPVIGPLGADGRFGILFRAGRNLYAYGRGGDMLDGWPMSGEGEGGGSAALAEGPGGMLYIFSAESPALISVAVGPQLEETTSRIFIRRYETSSPAVRDRGWFCYRHDQGGSSRQELAGQPSAMEGFVEGNSFICYPSPARGGFINVRVNMASPANVKIRVLNLQGEKVLEETHTHSWVEGSRVPFDRRISLEEIAGGIYICHLDAAGSGWRWSGARKFAVTR